MGLHLFNMMRRKKYERVLGGGSQQEGGLDLVSSSAGRSHKHRLQYSHDAQTNHRNTASTHAPQHTGGDRHTYQVKLNGAASGAGAAAAGSSSSSFWGFKLHPRMLNMRKKKSAKLGSIPSTAGPASQASAVQNFLQGPPQANGDDEVYQEQCRDLLRKLSARGNRVPGFI